VALWKYPDTFIIAFLLIFNVTERREGCVTIQIDFDKMGGLIPAVIQDYQNGEILMVAFMDKKTLDLTLKDGKTWFFSRTRNKYWMKGEESGNTQEVIEVLTDCDADTVVIKVKQNGPAACHTGNRSCFYVRWENEEWVEHSKPLFDPSEVYKKA
jgi:phosphoribosyl-AMP cyclohydrolase